MLAQWCREHGVLLSPHIKTTMCRNIVERQVAAGAWGVTVATVPQAAIAADWGHRRILIANEVVDRQGIADLQRMTAANRDLELYLFVDSVSGLEALRTESSSDSRVGLLIDVGIRGARTGVRSVQEAMVLADAIADSPEGVFLAGVGGYEGVVPNVRDRASLSAVDDLTHLAGEVFLRLSGRYGTPDPIFTMGGSAFPDRVVEHLPHVSEVDGAVAVIRSGCYVTHDHGMYAQVSPFDALKPALTVRAVVISTPDVGTAILGAGRRELPYDGGLPTLLRTVTSSGQVKSGVSAVGERIYDHHYVLRDVENLAVGDIVELGISHPCSAFDRWDVFTVIKDDDETERWATSFPRA